jgi:hypothetical protein
MHMMVPLLRMISMMVSVVVVVRFFAVTQIGAEQALRGARAVA